MPRDRSKRPLTEQRMKIRPDEPGIASVDCPRAHIVKQDEAFQAAMRKAIKAGKEGSQIPSSGSDPKVRYGY